MKLDRLKFAELIAYITYYIGTMNVSCIADIDELIDIYVPEVHYTNMTLVDYTVTRESRSGANLIIANCTFQEVRQVTFQYSTTSTSNSKNAQDQSVETSAVQANEPSPDAISKVRGLIGI